MKLRFSIMEDLREQFGSWMYIFISGTIAVIGMMELKNVDY